jgi:prenyl protein peptidase
LIVDCSVNPSEKHQQSIAGENVMMSPIITVQKAILLSAAHTLLYVGVLYVREASRPAPGRSKDHPSGIKARFAAVAVACLLSVFGNRYVIKQARQAGQITGIEAWDDIIGGWGEWKLDLKQALHALELTALLFLGPLVEKIWITGGWRYIGSEIRWAMTSVFGWRIFIIVRICCCDRLIVGPPV